MSVSENVGSPLTLIAAENLTIFRGVFIDSNGEAAECNDETQLEGIAQETVLAGQSVPIATNVGARLQLEADGAHALGARVSIGALGQAVTASAVGGELTAGTVMMASAAAGDILEILFSPRTV